MKILVTGGAGFIGSALIRWLIEHTSHSVINVDKLTYAGNLQSLEGVAHSARYQLEVLDICEREGLRRLFTSSQPDAVVHLAAESHVDRSIDDPGVFIQTNLVGTFEILEASRAYWQSLADDRRDGFRFLHVSTDEVYGDLAGTTDLFTEDTRYAPSSPYSASKAGSDHLARSWHRTYGMPVLVTNCSNNYGPYQFPEKLIPHMVLNALGGQPLPVYGDGTQVRDWLYVDDHARALLAVLERGQVGETYNIGGHNEHQNIEIVRMICAELQNNAAVSTPEGVARYDSLIRFVDDRPGHDLRYAIDAGKIAQELGWRPQETFATGLAKTIRWYLENQGWWGAVLDGSYQLERRGRASA